MALVSPSAQPSRLGQHRRRPAGRRRAAPDPRRCGRTARPAESPPRSAAPAPAWRPARSRCRRSACAQPVRQREHHQPETAATPPRIMPSGYPPRRDVDRRPRGGPVSSRPRTASMSTCSANRSAIRSSWASRRPATSTSSATTKPRRPAAPPTSVSQSPPEVVVVEQAVPVGAEHRAAADARTSAASRRSARARDLPVVDLVAAQRRASLTCAGSCRRRRRCRRPAGPGPSTAPAPDSTGSSMRRHSIWKPPQIPSTGRPVAACAMIAVGEAALAQPDQVGHRGLAARQHHEVGVGQLGGVGRPSAPARPAHRPAPRRRWSSRSAAAGSRRRVSHSSPSGGCGAPTTRSASTDRESSASSHSSSANGRRRRWAGR